MNALFIREVIELFQKKGLNLPLEITLCAQDFTSLQVDLYAARKFADKVAEKLEKNQVRIFGVTVTGKLCTCGAYPTKGAEE
jgi:2-phosphoglycerate kinase